MPLLPMTIASDDEVENESDSDEEAAPEPQRAAAKPLATKKADKPPAKAASKARKAPTSGGAASTDVEEGEMDEAFEFDDGSFALEDTAAKGWDFRGAIEKLAAQEGRTAASGGIAAMEERIAAKRRELKQRRRGGKSEKAEQPDNKSSAATADRAPAVAAGAAAAPAKAGRMAKRNAQAAEGEDAGIAEEAMAVVTAGGGSSNESGAESGDGDSESGDEEEGAETAAGAGASEDEEDGGEDGEDANLEADALRDYGAAAKNSAAAAASAEEGGGSENAEEDSGKKEHSRNVPGEENGGDEDAAEERRAKEFFEEAEPIGGDDDTLPFQALNLSRPILRAVEALGFVSPTPVQAKVVPLALAGRDVCASAATGSGKTAAFVLPILERLLYRPKTPAATRVLVVTPTRELAVQVHSMAEALARFTDVRCCLITGGAKNLRAQEAELRSRPDIVVCTPGRMVDQLTNSPGVHVEDLDVLVLDEADRLLELGFQDEVAALVKSCPRGRQTMLFSATMNTRVAELISLSLSKPVRVKADPVNRVAPRLVQEFIRIRKSREEDREAILLSLLCRTFTTKTIVFFDTKVQAHRAVLVLGLAGVAAAELHGNLTMSQRLEAMERFKAGDVHVLVATDLAARGLDVAGVHTVINFEMPRTRDTYIHRVGRTARAGCGGRAVTLIGEDRRLVMKEVLRSRDGNAEVKSRAVPESVIVHYRGKVEEMEEAIAAIMKEERVDRETRTAEMEISKASNIVQHRDEILARPAREWISSSKRKAELAEATAAQARAENSAAAGRNGDSWALGKPLKASDARKSSAVGAGEAEGKAKKKDEDKGHRLNRKKRRKLEAAKEAAAAAVEEGDDGRKTGGDRGLVKQAKREARQREMASRDLPAGAVRGTKRKLDVGGAGAFDVDFSEAKRAKRDGSGATVGKGGKDADVAAPSRYKFTDFDPEKRLRHKGKQGSKAFKSKAKHKRRR